MVLLLDIHCRATLWKLKPTLRHAEELNELLSVSSHIVVHCAAGLGRTGMFCAEMLVRMGWSAEDAIQRVRSIRPGVIETREQERYLSHGHVSGGF